MMNYDEGGACDSANRGGVEEGGAEGTLKLNVNVFFQQSVS